MPTDAENITAALAGVQGTRRSFAEQVLECFPPQQRLAVALVLASAHRADVFLEATQLLKPVVESSDDQLLRGLRRICGQLNIQLND